ncbi:hypothetical protein [Nocardioides sp. GCM10030258]|uniref:hypothetical protein n=1 Tax=unclassified Nocardioides TaxID=2615069 RepID=UPI00361BE92B
MANYCRYSSSDVFRAYLGATRINLRERTAYSGGQGVFASAANERFNATFFNQANVWAREYDDMFYNWVPGAGRLDWIGHVGTYGHCASSTTSMHHTGRALDLARIQCGSTGWFVDMNWSWKQGLMHRRRYLSAAAYLRRYFKTVIQFTDANHKDHIHFDNGSTLGGLKTTSKGDVTIMQMACNWQNGESLTINGTWTSGLGAAMTRLKTKMGMSCLDVYGNLDHAKIFLGVLAYDAANNQPAGQPWGVC